jgi:predicted kinase
MKKVIVLTGVSGVGKTHTRLNDPELKDLPCVDIADIYQEHPEFDWSDALYTLLQRTRLLLQKHKIIVVEGYFLPNSPSSRQLVNDMKVAGARVEFREFWEPFEVCQGRIARQFERGEISAIQCRGRIEMLRMCWRPREA